MRVATFGGAARDAVGRKTIGKVLTPSVGAASCRLTECLRPGRQGPGL